MRKVYLRLLPFAVLSYVLAYIDRINDWINSIGNLGGFFGPWYVGVMKDLTNSYTGGLYGLALLGLIAAVICAVFLHIPNRMPSSVVGAPAE